MELLSTILSVISWVLLAYFGFAAFYFFIFAIASHFYKERRSKSNDKKMSVLVLIPSYKEDSVILETSLAAYNHISTKAHIDIWVIADSLQQQTVERIKQAGVNVLEVSFSKSTKAKSINKALQTLSGSWSYIILLDADNVMADGFIDKLIDRLQAGFRIVQGHRTAKNSNTAFALLDGLSEEVNNSIFRKGHRVLGLSASLIGSGFACEYHLFRILMLQNEAVGGFDKKLELDLLKEKIRIGYAENAMVFDEKVQQGEAFVNQRRRWLSAQLVYFWRYAPSAAKQLFLYGNIDYVDKIYQFITPPRIITVGFSFLLVVVNLTIMAFSGWTLTALNLAWLTAFVLSVGAILLGIPAKLYTRGLWYAIITLPKVFLLMTLALVKLRGANKRFIHTQHGIK